MAQQQVQTLRQEKSLANDISKTTEKECNTIAASKQQQLNNNNHMLKKSKLKVNVLQSKVEKLQL